MNGNIKRRRAEAQVKAMSRRGLTTPDRAGIAVVVAIAVVGLFAWAMTEDGYSCNPKPIRVVSGDTLFDIAHANCTGNVNRAVDDLFGKYGANLQIGEVVQLESK